MSGKKVITTMLPQLRNYSSYSSRSNLIRRRFVQATASPARHLFAGSGGRGVTLSHRTYRSIPDSLKENEEMLDFLKELNKDITEIGLGVKNLIAYTKAIERKLNGYRVSVLILLCSLGFIVFGDKIDVSYKGAQANEETAAEENSAIKISNDDDDEEE